VHCRRTTLRQAVRKICGQSKQKTYLIRAYARALLNNKEINQQNGLFKLILINPFFAVRVFRKVWRYTVPIP
jgi:hypothetical protein